MHPIFCLLLLNCHEKPLASVCVPSLFFILLHKEWSGRPRDGSANYSACRPRSSAVASVAASKSSCCAMLCFSDKLRVKKKMANQQYIASVCHSPLPSNFLKLLANSWQLLYCFGIYMKNRA